MDVAITHGSSSCAQLHIRHHQEKNAAGLSVIQKVDESEEEEEEEEGEQEQDEQSDESEEEEEEEKSSGAASGAAEVPLPTNHQKKHTMHCCMWHVLKRARASTRGRQTLNPRPKTKSRRKDFSASAPRRERGNDQQLKQSGTRTRTRRMVVSGAGGDEATTRKSRAFSTAGYL